MSIGLPIQGRLRCATRLPEPHPHLYQLPAFRSRGTSFATSELIRLLRHAATEVAERHPGSRLALGNLSLRRGGILPFSRSHQSGRDADLLFYSLYQGRPVEPQRMHAFGPALHSRHRPALTFDVARNWTLVRSLLTHPSIQVQWIIVAPHLEHALLKHAKGLGEPQHILQRAEAVLHQPPGLGQHDNHFHLRIYCSLHDRLAGCQDLPPFWPNISLHEPAARQHFAGLLKHLTHPTASLRLRALERLIQLNARDLAPDIATHALRDPVPSIRTAALEALEKWRPGAPGVTHALEHLLWRPGSGFGEPRQRAPAPRVPRRTQALSDRILRPPLRLSHNALVTRSIGIVASPMPHYDGQRHAQQIRLAYRLLAQLPGAHPTALIERGLASPRQLRLNVSSAAHLPEALLAALAARQRRERSLVPALLHCLTHEDPRVRNAADQALRAMGNHRIAHRVDASRESEEHRLAVITWTGWWQRRQGWSDERLLWEGFINRVPEFPTASPRRRLALLVGLTTRRDEIGENAHRILTQLAGPAVFREPPPGQGRLAYWTRWLRSLGPLYPGRVLEGPRNGGTRNQQGRDGNTGLGGAS